MKKRAQLGALHLDGALARLVKSVEGLMLNLLSLTQL